MHLDVCGTKHNALKHKARKETKLKFIRTWLYQLCRVVVKPGVNVTEG